MPPLYISLFDRLFVLNSLSIWCLNEIPNSYNVELVLLDIEERLWLSLINQQPNEH